MPDNAEPSFIRSFAHGMREVVDEVTWDTAKHRRSRPYVTRALTVDLPWPMTKHRAVLFEMMIFTVLFGGVVLVAWVTTLVTEPSLWRIVVPVAYLFAFKYGFMRFVVPRCAPRDASARWDAIRAWREQW